MTFSIDDIIRLSKTRGFVYPGSEIYGGFANSYTYGPLGSELKNNIKQLWWKNFVQDRQDMVGIDGTILLHPKTWHASGHVAGFNDQMVDCKNCKARLRADHLVEDALDMDCEGMPDDEVTKIITDNKLKCPKCGEQNFTDVRKFNLMFETQMAKTGEESTAYLRPETAQAIFLEFKNVTDTARVKVPFGIAQIGKAFRNEITPGNYIFRVLEFEQMEIEYFIAPPKGFKENREAYLDKSKGIAAWAQEDQDYFLGLFASWQKDMKNWCDLIGLDPAKCHDKEHAPDKLSHYSLKTIDIEFDFPFGRKELYGCAYRTDFDLSQHQQHSGKKLTYRDPQTNEEYIPHVIEPTFGVDRSILAVLCSAYHTEKLEGDEERIVLKFKPNIAPIKVAILPLMKKDGLPDIANDVWQELKSLGNCEIDVAGSIGKRYRRQDEVGTPVCITIDYETKDDQTVTIRDRDTMNQERVKIKDLLSLLKERYFG